MSRLIQVVGGAGFSGSWLSGGLRNIEWASQDKVYQWVRT